MPAKLLSNDFSSTSARNTAGPNLAWRAALAAAVALTLAACGGGGDGSGSGSADAGTSTSSTHATATPADGNATATSESATLATAGTATSPTAPAPTGGGTDRACYTVTGTRAAPVTGAIALLPARGAGVSGYRVLGDARSAGLCYANYRREQVGLPPLTARDPLNTVAQNHTSYMLSTGTLTHNETAGTPGYTGATPDARIQAAYKSSATAEVVAAANMWTSAANANLSMSPKDQLVVNLVDAPFHRAALLGSYGSAGSGYAERVAAGSGGGTQASYYQTIDLADVNRGGAGNLMVAYPFDGQADVPVNWVNTESPNPAPGYSGKTMGYPVTLQAIDTSLQFNADTFTITDAQGRNMACQKVDARTSGMSSYARGLAMCTPLAPLAAKTRYTVNVAGTLGGTGMNIRWAFTTR